MTDVNRHNFHKFIPEIIERIQCCTFVAIDAEYTGLFNPERKSKNSLFDSASERYAKLRQGLSNFQISQFGVSIFTRTWERNEYMVDAYNIYLYPVAFDDYRNLDVLTCQISSFNFLAANNFDFNKFIKEGVPYLRNDERKNLRQYLRANPRFMRWTENRDRTYFPQFLETLNDDDIENIIEHLSGFTKVIHAISESYKPVVGHNMLMDLILIYKQFYEDLPSSYFNFKKRIHELFPNIYDSKHIAATLRRDILEFNTNTSEDGEYLINTTLFTLYLNVAKLKDLFVPFITPLNDTKTRYNAEIEAGKDEHLETIKGSHCHEAGLDAVITGSVFLRLAHISLRRNHQFLSRRSFPPTVVESLSALTSYKNCVNLGRAQIRFINFDGNDPAIDKPYWIKVEGNPGKEKVLDIVEMRKKLPKLGDIDIVQLNDNTVLLACSAWTAARNVWSTLEAEGFILSAQEFPRSPRDTLILVAVITLSSASLLGALFFLKKIIF